MKINDLFESCSDIYCELMAPVCRSYALTQMELTILLFLANNPQDDTAALIVRKRRLMKSHVSVSVRALRERGYLACEHEGEDRRTVHLRPLEAALPVIADGRAVQELFVGTLLKGFSEDERARLAGYLVRVAANVREYGRSAGEKKDGRE